MKSVKLRPARNAVKVAMMKRSQKAGAHLDRKTEARRKAKFDNAWKDEA